MLRAQDRALFRVDVDLGDAGREPCVGAVRERHVEQVRVDVLPEQVGLGAQVDRDHQLVDLLRVLRLPLAVVDEAEVLLLAAVGGDLLDGALVVRQGLELGHVVTLRDEPGHARGVRDGRLAHRETRMGARVQDEGLHPVAREHRAQHAPGHAAAEDRHVVPVCLRGGGVLGVHLFFLPLGRSAGRLSSRRWRRRRQGSRARGRRR